MPRTTPGQGVLLRPTFNSVYGVTNIEVLAGGAGYAQTDPPKITIEGTATPSVEGVFYPLISGIGTVSEVVIFKTGAGYFPVFNQSQQSGVVVERGAFGTIATSHSSAGIAYSVFAGDYNIVDDNIIFTDAPYGKAGPAGLQTNSSFSGRLFSRKLDSFDPKDKNVILDDISLEFTGIAGTQFTLTENTGVVTSLYNAVNTGVDINNNPFILINNVVQTPGLDFEVLDNATNKLNFLSGVPRAGRISKVGLQTGAGYYTPRKAAARVGVGSTGSIEFIQLEGKGQGYNEIPEITVRASQGYGASITALLGQSSTTSVAISTVTYNHITGVATFTTGSAHGFEIDDRVRVTGAGFTFAPVSAARNIGSFGYDYITGIATVQVFGGHYIGTDGNQSRNLLIKEVQVTEGISTFLFREDGYPIVSVASTQIVTVMAGIGTQPLIYVSGGLVQAGIDTAIMDGRNVTGFDLIGTTANTFKAVVGISSFAHDYVGGAVVNRAEAGIITSFSIVEGGTGFYAPKHIEHVNQNPPTGITTVTAIGDKDGDSKNINALEYDSISGVATITAASAHGLSTSNVVKLSGIAFSTGVGDIIFPSDTQKYFGVTGINSTLNFTINIGIAMTTTGIHTANVGAGIGSYIPYKGHELENDDFVQTTGVAVTFTSAPAVQVGHVEYDETSGIATVTTRKDHNLTEDDCVVLSGIAFTCDYDPALGVSSALYDNTTGVLTVTTAAPHGYKVGKDVILTGLAFTCALDNGAKDHYYPRSRSTSYDTSIPITGYAGTGLSMDVGISRVKNQYIHRFEEAVTGAIIYGGDYPHQFLRAEEGSLLTGGPYLHGFYSATATSTFAGGNYAHTYVSSDDKTIKTGGDYAHIFDSAVTDAVNILGGGSLTPTNADYTPTTGSLIVTSAGHGLSGPSQHSLTTANYNPIVGILTITVPTHGFSNGDQVLIANDSIGWKCSLDGFTTTKYYPRTTDTLSNTWVPISNVTGDTFEVFAGITTRIDYTVSGADYTPSTGIMTMSIGSHDLISGQTFKFKPESLGFTCDADGNSLVKYYPRSKDPTYDTAVPILGVAGTTITTQVGITTEVKYNIRFAAYTPQSGIMTVSLDRLHDFQVGESIKFKPGSIVFKCDQDFYQTKHFYPRPSDPYYEKTVTLVGAAGTLFTVNVGPTTSSQMYAFVPNQGVAVDAVIAGGAYPYNLSGIGTDAMITGGGDYTPYWYQNSTTGAIQRPTQKVSVVTGGISFKCAKDNYATVHAYPRPTDPINNLNVGIVSVTTDTFEIRVGVSTIRERGISTSVYNPATGELTMTVGAGHSYINDSAHTISTATYNSSTGVLEPTISNHGFVAGEYVKFDLESISFKCDQDGYTATKAYPRYSDPFLNEWLPIYHVGVNTFSVNVGVSTIVNAYWFQSATTGGLKKARNTVGINTGSIIFTCDRDDHATEHAYPRSYDPIGGNVSVGIGSTSATTLTINVGVSTIVNYGIATAAYTPNTGIMTVFSNVHGLNGAYDDKRIQFATYDAGSGIMTVTTNQSHGMITGNRVNFKRDSIRFRCLMNQRQSVKSYPRAKDPSDQKWLSVTGIDETNFSVNVGTSPLVYHDPTSGSYDPFTGLMTVDIGSHTLKKGTGVKLKTRGFKFTCALDNHATNHFYPRASGISGPDPAYNTSVKITSTTDTTITLDVGKSSNQTEHIFVSAGTSSVISGGNYIHTFENADLDSLLIARDTVGLSTNSYTWRCAQDNYATDHTYPRTTDPIHDVEVGIVSSTLDTFTMNVGITSRVKFNISNATYDPNSGLVTMTTDSSHGLSTTTSVGLATNGFVYTCTMDQNSTEHAYPRVTDPAHNTSLYPTAVTANNVTVNVGVSTRVEYNINHADYNDVVGIMTMFLPTAHGITTAAGAPRNVKLKNESIYFTCSKDGYATAHVYPKGGDPYYNGSIVNRVIDNQNIEIQVGPSTTPSFYNGGGKIQGVILAPRLRNNSPSSEDFAAGGTFVDKIIDDHTYVVNVGISTVDHNYARGGISQQGKRVAASNEIGFSGFDVIEKIDAGKFRVNAGLTTEIALFKRGGRIDKPVFLDITEPAGYFNRDLEYISGNSGLGTNAVVNFRINVDGNIGEFELREEGTAYKVDEVLTVSGIATNPRVGVLTEFQLTVQELENDTFSGFYPGQFILFDDIASFFNGSRTKFTLSVTTSGVTEILSLKTLPGSDMDITNNIFIYINDILQTPQSSYTFKGSRVIFSEAPKPNSKCSVFYFRGSARDVETVEPVSSVKAGDIVQIKENKLNPADIDQFARTGKRIVASDVLETFSYDSIGIDTNTAAERPLSWEKQRQDQILSGVLISKARPGLKSKVLPTTRIIKNVGELDDKIYVNNAFPVFNAIDLLVQSERDVQIFEDSEISPGVVTSIVSTSSSISSLNIVDEGTGYKISNPTVAISSALIERKDPIFAWEFDSITGITSSIEFKSITKEDPYVAVGASSYYMNTKSGTFWERGRIGFGGTITFNGVSVGNSATGNVNVMAVGEFASMARGVSIGNSIGSWTPINLLEQRQIPAIGQVQTLDSTYTGHFNDVIWEGSRNTWVAVGAAGSIFSAVGLTTADAFSQFSGTLQNLNAVCYGQSEYVAVGNGGVILASNDGTGWGDKTSNTVFDLNDIIYDGNKFIVVGDNGTIGISTDKNFWQPWSQQLPAGTVHPATFDFAKIKFFDNFYVGISTVGDLYYSFDLANWNKRVVTQPNEIRDLVQTPYGDFASTRVIVVGSGTTNFYADPVINRATATASVTAGVITSINITDGGFGYRVGSSPPVIVQSDATKREDLFSVDAEGDFGDIVGINTWLPGSASVLPRLAFTLKSQFNDNTNLGYGYSSLNSLGVNFSGLEKGDFFTIYDSSLVVGHALTGITTSSGANQPVGMVTSGDYLGGVFRVEQITTGDAISGLVTVTCAFQPGPTPYGNNTIQVGVGTTATTDTFWGKYSWGKLLGYQNRGAGNPTSFLVNPMNGNVGLSTAAVVSRKKPLT